MHPAAQSVVLIAHDDLAVCARLGMLLSTCGHVVLGPATKREEALRLLDHITPDAALLGWNLDGGSILPVARRLLDLELPFALIADVADPKAESGPLQFVSRIDASPDQATFGRFLEGLLQSHPPSILAAESSSALFKGSANPH